MYSSLINSSSDLKSREHETLHQKTNSFSSISSLKKKLPHAEGVNTKNKTGKLNSIDFSQANSRIMFNSKLIDEEPEDLKIKALREINDVKKLTQWDKEHIKPILMKESKKSIKNKTDPNLIRVNSILSPLKKEMESINSISVIKENLSKLSFAKTNKILEDFANKNLKEQGTIFMQNISKTKNIFNFGQFLGKSKKSIENDLNINMEEIHSFNEMSTEYYRQLIKDKNKMELQYRTQVMEVAHKIFEKKLKKKRVEAVLNEIYDEIENCKQELINRNISLDNELHMLEKHYHQTLGFAEEGVIPSNKGGRVLLKEERLQFMGEFQFRASEIEKKRKLLQADYESIQGKLRSLCELNKSYVIQVEKEIKYLKSIYDSVTKDQRSYYLDILKKGIDVRFEGLVWVVRRLKELSTNFAFDYSVFPKFLSHSHIEYVIKCASLQIESNQLKIILKSLKVRQKKLREEENTKRFDEVTRVTMMQITQNSLKSSKVKSLSNTFGSNMFELTNSNKRTGTRCTSPISKRMRTNFEKMYHKYESLVKVTMEQRCEDEEVKSIVTALRQKLNEYSSKGEAFFNNDDHNNIIKLFMENDKKREYFEEILLLRKRIKEIDEILSNIRIEMMKAVKKQNELNDNKNAKSSLYYDLVYSALFGNGITI